MILVHVRNYFGDCIQSWSDWTSYPRLVIAVEKGCDDVPQLHLGVLMWIKNIKQWSPWSGDGINHVTFILVLQSTLWLAVFCSLYGDSMACCQSSCGDMEEINNVWLLVHSRWYVFEVWARFGQKCHGSAFSIICQMVSLILMCLPAGHQPKLFLVINDDSSAHCLWRCECILLLLHLAC